MSKSNERQWKKVYRPDLVNIISEFRDFIEAPAVIILSGELGAGKTTFTQCFTDIKELTSPTYAMIQEFGKSAHADFYRLEDEQELIHLELGLYLEGKNYFLVEWGKKYVPQLEREVPERFHFYELEIVINPPSSTDNGECSRNYFLKKLSRT